MSTPERKAPTGTITGKPTLDTDWLTPPELLHHVRAYFGGTIPFDPATSPDNPTQALAYCTGDAGDNGLDVDWAQHAGVFVNPPYGRALRAWLGKIDKEARKGVPIVSLLPCARWEQHYLQQTLTAANAICFVRKRVKFVRASSGDRPSGNPYANMFVAFNVDMDAFVRAFSQVGCVVEIAGRAAGPLASLSRAS